MNNPKAGSKGAERSATKENPTEIQGVFREGVETGAGAQEDTKSQLNQSPRSKCQTWGREAKRVA